MQNLSTRFKLKRYLGMTDTAKFVDQMIAVAKPEQTGEVTFKMLKSRSTDRVPLKSPGVDFFGRDVTITASQEPKRVNGPQVLEVKLTPLEAHGATDRLV